MAAGAELFGFPHPAAVAATHPERLAALGLTRAKAAALIAVAAVTASGALSWERLRRLPVPEVEEELASLEREHGPGAPTDGARPVSEAELASLASGPVEIGGHTITHPSLPVLRLDEQEREIADGRARLEELLGRPPETFSYPYGDYDDATVRLVEQAGFRLACSVVEGSVSRDSPPFLLPRYAVRDWPAKELERRLATWG